MKPVSVSVKPDSVLKKIKDPVKVFDGHPEPVRSALSSLNNELQLHKLGMVGNFYNFYN